MSRGTACVATALLGILSVALSSQGAEPAAVGGGAVILDSAGMWRMYHTLSRPVMQDDNGLKAIPYGEPNTKVTEVYFWHKDLLGKPPVPVAADWMKPDFDDSAWIRGTAYRAARTPYLEKLCLRGKFVVSDPAKVKDLHLEVAFHGGAVVYVNGQEAGRQNVAAPSTGAGQAGALAEAYPKEAFVAEDGSLISVRGDEPLWKKAPTPETAKRIASRDRKVSVVIPAKGLRAGTNVIAIELVRAPYHKAVSELLAMSKNHGDHKTFDLTWNTCEIKGVRLVATSAEGLTGNAVRPEGLQVWNSDPEATDYDLDFGIPAETLGPIRLVGAANGTYSGKVGVGSTKAIRGLAATAGELTGPAGAIPATAIRTRFGMPWGDITLTNADCGEMLPYPAEPTPLLALLDAAPAEIPVYKKEITKRCLKLPGQPEPVFGAVSAVWVTVKVPADAKPGTYSGQVTISAEGAKAVTVPVSLKVASWKLPDPANWKTWVELIESPDTLVTEYGMPAWSPKHWEMIGKSMDYMAEVGSKVIFAPLIAQSNAGNEQSMVRWIKKGENQYDYDFSILEKYLDTAEKHMGKPEVVIFNAWERYLMRKDSSGRAFQVEGGLKVAIAGPMVTVVDAAGKAANVILPDYTDPNSKALWKPLYDQLRERMKKRGLEKTMQLGLCSDFWATKEQVEFLKEVSGDLPWANAGHYIRPSLYNGLAQFAYQSSYFGVQFGYNKSLSGWKMPELYALFERVPLDNYPMSKWRLLSEQSITGSSRGPGRMGADAWYAIKDKSGKRLARLWEKYPAANWGYLNSNCAVLAAGPEGAVATQRFEALREGTQECEAIIVLEKALGDKAAAGKLGAELAKRCQDTLDERRSSMWQSFGLYQSGPDYSHEPTSWRERQGVTGYLWLLGSPWQDRSEKLFTLAGEVDKTLGGK